MGVDADLCARHKGGLERGSTTRLRRAPKVQPVDQQQQRRREPEHEPHIALGTLLAPHFHVDREPRERVVALRRFVAEPGRRAELLQIRGAQRRAMLDDFVERARFLELVGRGVHHGEAQGRVGQHGLNATLTRPDCGVFEADQDWRLIAFPLSAKIIVGTDIFHAAALLWVAGMGHLVAGNVDVSAIGWLLVGSIPGVLIGSQISVGIPDRMLRFALSAALILSGIKLLAVPYANQIVVATIIGGLSALAAWGVIRFLRRRGLAGPLPERQQPEG